MNNETIKCPFCFKESQFGVRVCTGCHSTIKYGEVSPSVIVVHRIYFISNCLHHTLYKSKFFSSYHYFVGINDFYKIVYP